MRQHIEKHRRRKSFKARTLSGAARRVRELERLLEEANGIVRSQRYEARLLAMLGAEGPCFNNPLTEIQAVKIRDRILKSELNLAPDGAPLPREAEPAEPFPDPGV